MGAEIRYLGHPDRGIGRSHKAMSSFLFSSRSQPPDAHALFSRASRAKRVRWTSTLLCLLFFRSAALFAHDPGLSTADVRIGNDEIRVTVSFSPTDARRLLPEATAGDAPAALSDAEWEPAARAWCMFRLDDVVVPPTSLAIVVNTRDTLRFTARYAGLRGRTATLELPAIARLPVGHREFTLVSDADGRILARRFLSASDSRMEFAIGEPPSDTTPQTVGAPMAGFLGFLWLGVQHIWTGYDHLLFLFALIVVCRRLSSIAAIVSCFTLAHSLTLAAATLNLAVLPSRFVEPAIAASIVFVAVENLIRRGGEARGRAVLTFTFGLIHGFGFASVLRDLGVGANGTGVLVPLLAFNSGVELGQITIAALALPILWWLRRSNRFTQFGVPVLSSIVGLAGLYWLLARTVLA